MIIKRAAKILWRLISDFQYSRETTFSIKQKIDNGTFWSWLRNGLKRRIKVRYKLLRSALIPISSAGSAHDYIMAIRFNQAPHPKHYKERKRLVSHAYSQERTPRFIAYYLPQFHPFEINNKAWGKGFTEWTNTTKAVPQYKGHYQPHLPADLGFYDLRLAEILRSQIDLAKSYGIHGFCFHYYWFDGQKVMDLPIHQFLSNPDMELPFCICWANENWTRRWDGLDSEIILQQNYTREKCLDFIKDILPILTDARYITVAGKPLLVIYRPLLIPDLVQVVEAWRLEAQKAGLPGLWLVCAQAFGLTDPRSVGFDAAVEFPPHKINERIEDIPPPDGLWNTEFKGHIWRYADAAAESITRAVRPYPLYRCAFPSWDNEARKISAGNSFFDANPPDFGEWLATCSSYARETSSHYDNFVFVNAWNEWAEGAHLEPDRHFGYAWLEQVANQAEKRYSFNVPSLSYSVPLTPSPASARTAVVIHLYYEDTWNDIKQTLSAIQEPFDLIVTTTAEKHATVNTSVKVQYPGAEIYVVENRGRDIRPFMAVLPLLLHRTYNAVLKLHSKKSLHRGDGDLWRKTLLAQLLPSVGVQSMWDTLNQYPSLGLIAPAGNVLNVQRYMGSNQAWVAKLVDELGESAKWLSQSRPWFAAGSMFWLKPQAIQSLLECPSVRNDLFEDEKGQIDGTLAHALERVFGCVALSSGYHLVDTKLAKNLVSADKAIRLQAQKNLASEWGCSGRKRTVDSLFARPTENDD